MAISHEDAEEFLPSHRTPNPLITSHSNLSSDDALPSGSTAEALASPCLGGWTNWGERHPDEAETHGVRDRNGRRMEGNKMKQEVVSWPEEKQTEEGRQQLSNESRADEADVTESGCSDDDSGSEDALYPLFSSRSSNAYHDSSEEDNADGEDDTDEAEEDDEDDDMDDDDNLYSSDESITDEDHQGNQEHQGSHLLNCELLPAIAHQQEPQDSDNGKKHRDHVVSIVNPKQEPDGAGLRKSVLHGESIETRAENCEGNAENIVDHIIPPSGQVEQTELLVDALKPNANASSKRRLDGDDTRVDDQQDSSKRQKMSQNTEVGVGAGRNHVGQMQLANSMPSNRDHSETRSVTLATAVHPTAISKKTFPGTASGNWPALRSTKTFSAFSLSEQSRTLRDWMAEAEEYMACIQAGAIPATKMSRFFRHVNKHLDAVTETLDDVALAAHRFGAHHKTAREEMGLADVERREIGELLGRFAPPSSTPAITQNSEQDHEQQSNISAFGITLLRGQQHLGLDSTAPKMATFVLKGVVQSCQPTAFDTMFGSISSG